MTYGSKLKGFTSPVYIVLCLLLALSVVHSQNFKCPQLLNNIKDVCERIKCANPVSKEDCSNGTIYVDNFALCGCCPSCVRYIYPTDDEPCTNDPSSVIWTVDPECKDEDEFCRVKVNTCLPGFVCNGAQKCVEPSASLHPDKDECMFRKSLRVLGLVHWDPDCAADGSFSPKQCKGSHFDGECYCVDREGNRIFGREWRINAENQTCECSRRAHELRKGGLTATFHCTSDGNFEPLQCDTDSGLCYCVNPQTGELDGGVLPESQWKSLPCFSLNLTDHQKDGKYLRQCESVFAGVRQLRLIGKDHGTDLGMAAPNCDFDGSFAPVQIKDTISECVFKNGSRILDNFSPKLDNMTCNCARDKYEYLPSQKVPHLDCEQRTGNYDKVYDFGSYASCVDRDGFLYGEVVVSKYFCCLLYSGCSDNMLVECGLEKIKQCDEWWFKS